MRFFWDIISVPLWLVLGCAVTFIGWNHLTSVLPLPQLSPLEASVLHILIRFQLGSRFFYES